MKAHVVARSPHQLEWGGAFAQGLERHGWSVDMMNEPGPCDLAILWGVRNQKAIAAQRARGGEVCILERGYLGDRFAWTSVSFGGGLNGRARFCGVSDDPTRFAQHFGAALQPWQMRDGIALLIGQVPGDMSLAAVGGQLDHWYAAVTAALIDRDYEVRFRPHPVTLQRGLRNVTPAGAKVVNGTLSEALAEAALTVTYNSNSAVESVLAGVPTIAMDEGSMAWPVTAHEIGAILTPAREAWAAELAWKQWTLAEMADGTCWEHQQWRA